MSIRIISDDERLTLECSGVTFVYRRPSADRYYQLMSEHTSRGELDSQKFNDAMLAWCVLDWSGNIFLGDSKEPLPFTVENLMRLPPAVRTLISNEMAANIDGKHVKVKVDPT